jgi:hypothetical protein
VVFLHTSHFWEGKKDGKKRENVGCSKVRNRRLRWRLRIPIALDREEEKITGLYVHPYGTILPAKIESLSSEYATVET